MRKLLLGIAFLVIVVAAGLTVASFVLDRTKVKTHTIAGPVREIVVKSAGGDVRLVPASKQVQVRETQHYLLQAPTLKKQVTDGVLTLDTRCNQIALKCSTDLRLMVPPGIRLTVEADSGDVAARKLDARAVHVRSDSGDVTLDLVGRQQLAWAHTDSGYVEIIAADARAVDAQTDSGDVAIDVFRRAPRRVVARSDSGSVQVLVPGGEYAVDAETDSGVVKVTGISRNDRAPRSIEAKTDSGDVAVRAR